MNKTTSYIRTGTKGRHFYKPLRAFETYINQPIEKIRAIEHMRMIRERIEQHNRRLGIADIYIDSGHLTSVWYKPIILHGNYACFFDMDDNDCFFSWQIHISEIVNISF